MFLSVLAHELEVCRTFRTCVSSEPGVQGAAWFGGLHPGPTDAALFRRAGTWPCPAVSWFNVMFEG